MFFNKRFSYVKKGVITGAIALSLLSTSFTPGFLSPAFASENNEAENPLSLINENQFNGKIDTDEELRYLYERIDYIKSRNYFLSELEQKDIIVNADLDYKNTPILVNQYSSFPLSLIKDSLEIEQNEVEYFYLADYSLHFPSETKNSDTFLAELSADGVLFPKKTRTVSSCHSL